jgi:hypothetical protein
MSNNWKPVFHYINIYGVNACGRHEAKRGYIKPEFERRMNLVPSDMRLCKACVKIRENKKNNCSPNKK